MHDGPGPGGDGEGLVVHVRFTTKRKRIERNCQECIAQSRKERR
jgi:hypothetical protein